MNEAKNPNRRSEQYLKALNAIAEVLSGFENQEDRILRILDILDKHLGLRRGTLMLLSPNGEELLFELATNVRPCKALPIGYRKGEGVVGKVLQHGEPVYLESIANAPDFRNRIHERDAGETEMFGFICVPVKHGAEVLGALSVDIPREAIPNLGEDQRMLSVVVSMIAHDVRMRRQSLLQRRTLEEENRRLYHQLDDTFRPENMVGASDRMKAVYQRIQQVASSDTTVMIRGESGTGKELAASAIHYNSPRSGEPFVKLNCAALSESLLESELFGHEKGAFTGAVKTRIGRLEEAEGGTLFLDEIGDFSLAIQVKLLRVLQEREYSRVGGNQVRKANVRFIVATNRDLEKAVEENGFRQDLYYRINVFPVFLPPLRERRDDIMNLANHFVEKYARRMGKSIRRVSTTAINMLMAYHWPGNVRELENCMEHAVLLCPGEAIQGIHLPPTLTLPGKSRPTPTGSLTSRVEQLERDMIVDALKRTGGNISASARELGITARQVKYKIERLGIEFDKLFSRK